MKNNYQTLRQKKRIAKATLLACVLTCSITAPTMAALQDDIATYVNKRKFHPKVKEVLLYLSKHLIKKNPAQAPKLKAILAKIQTKKTAAKNLAKNDVLGALKFIEQNIEHFDPTEALIATEMLTAHAYDQIVTRAGEIPPAPVAGVIQNNQTLAGSTAIGYNSLGSHVGSNNTAVGLSALANLAATGKTPNATPAGVENTAVGGFALTITQTGKFNTGVGYQALAKATGSGNIALGHNAGNLLVGGENNIYVGHAGIKHETGAIHIGTPDVHQACYIAGVNGASVTDGTLLFVGSDGKLGTGAGGLDLNGSATIQNNIYLPITTHTQGGIYIGDYVGEYIGEYFGKNLTNAPFISGFEANTFVGMGAGNLDSENLLNSGFGYLNQANGEYCCCNTSAGFASMFSNKTGSCNTASGTLSLLLNTSGSQNTTSGSLSMALNETGSQNTASGYGALMKNTKGSFNTASGSLALSSNITGSLNTATGYLALSNNITGSQNTAIGYQALLNNKYGNLNVALGTNALALATGNQNIGIGITGSGGDLLVSGSNNICIGSPGVHNDNATIRLGTVTTHTQCVVAGIKNNNNTSPYGIVVIDSNGRLGYMSGGQLHSFITPP